VNEIGVLLAVITNYLSDSELMVPSTICRSWQQVISYNNNININDTASPSTNDAGSGGWSRIRARATAYQNIRHGKMVLCYFVLSSLVFIGRFALRTCVDNIPMARATQDFDFVETGK
jgi:hypothetical protein